jgi:hypothetical protein
VHKAIHRFARGVDKVGHFVATHKQAVITAAVIIATLPLDETGIGEAIDADVIGADVTADGAADVVSDEIASEGTQAASAANATDEAATEGAGDFPESDPGVAIGEDMANRVQPFADRVGADTYQPDPTAPEEQWEQNQRDWINKQMDDGRTLRDCGPAPGNPNFPQISSRWYGIEKGEIAKRNYPVTPVDC